MVFDTNILIAYLNGEDRVVRFILNERLQGRVLFVSAISIAEVLSLPKLTDTEIRGIRAFLEGFLVVPFDTLVAEKSADLRRGYKVTIPDAGIAATALIHAVPLVTRDKGLAKISELTIVDL